MRAAERRSAAVVRAQAHLAGRRAAVRGPQEQDGSPGCKVPTARPSSHHRGLSALHTASNVSILSDTSSTHLGREEEAEKLSLGGTTHLPQPNSRFLKQKPQKVATDSRQAGLNPATRTALSAGSMGRPNAILRKLAQIEDKIRSRKSRQDINWVPPALDDELSVSESVHSSEQRARGLKYLKKAAGLKEVAKAHTRDVPPRGDTHPGSEERGGQGIPTISKEREGLLEHPLGRKVSFPSSQKSSLPGQSSPKKPPHGASSLPSSSSSSISILLPRDSSPPSVKGSPTGAASSSLNSVCPRGLSLSDQSIIWSLDELFSEAADTPRDASSSSNSDFRVNVFSLDDLLCSTASQKEDGEAEAVAAHVDGKSRKELGAALAPSMTQSSSSAPNVTVGKATALAEEEEEDLAETEVSEQLNGTSAGHSPCEDENPGSADYSDDFEPSPSSAASEGPQRRSSLDVSCASLDASKCSSSSDLSSFSCPPEGIRKSRPLHRITVKDAAVQTNCSLLAYHGLQNDVHVEAAPVSSHMLSLDVVEALTTCSPAAFALNDLLKQIVLLIKQFAETSRCLHDSFVASLEEEDFHYHSLEEARSYIDWHKPLPLTMEQALRQLEEQQ